MKLKRWAALVLALVMTFGLSGCVGNFYENAGTINGTEISSGLYLMAQYNAFLEARSKDEIDAEKDIFKQKIDDEKMSDWLNTRTEEELRRYVAVRALARERDIEMDATGQENMQQIAQFWSYQEDLYKKNGIGYSSFERYLTTDELSRQLFQSLYAEGGELAVSDAELKKEYGEKYAHMRACSIPLNALEEGVDVQSEVLALVEAFPAKMQAGMSMESMVEKELPAVYKLLQREFDPETVTSALYSNYVAYAPPNFDTYSEEFLAHLKTQKVGDFGSYNMGSTVIVYELVPTFTDDAEFETEKETVISRLKSEAYEDYLRAIYEEYPVEWQPMVRTYFRPSKIKTQ